MNPGSFLMRASIVVLAVATFAVTGCSKDKKDEGDAAADATTLVVVADAAADAGVAVADAAVDAADAAAAPLTTAVTVQPTGKPKVVDPPICAAARSAKARKSPAAAGLEKQCVAAGGTM